MTKFSLLSAMVVLLLSCSGIVLAHEPFSLDYSSDRYVEFEFNLKDYQLVRSDVNGEEHYRIIHPKAAFIMNEGLPELPLFSTSIAIPNTGTPRIKEIQVIESEIVENILIYPSQGFDLDPPPGSVLSKDESFYLKDVAYPETVSLIGTPAVMRDIRFVAVNVTPFIYNPARAELEVNTRVRVRIEIDHTLSGVNEIDRPFRRLSRSFETIYRSVFLNYDSFVSPDWDYQARSILVIHHHNAILQPLIDQYVNWKRDKGFEITATNTQNLPTNTAIKNYIQTAYNTWEHPPEYVVLVGGGSGSYMIPTFQGHPNLASDHPYTLLEGNDDISDVFIGRFPIYEQNHLPTLWNKIRNYEREPFTGNMSWYQNALLCGSPTGWGISTLFTPKYVKELMLLSNPDYTFSEVYHSPFATQINAALNQGSFVWNYRGYYGFYYDWSSSGPINNGLMLPYCFFLTCHTLAYNNSSNSETERFVTLGTPVAPKGGIAAIGINTGESKTAYNNALSGSFTYGIFNEGIRTLGETLARGKLFLHETYGIVHPTHPPQFSHWVNLMGDPSMDIWTDVPKTMYVSYNDELSLGSNYIDIQVTDYQDQPVKDAWVTIRQDDDVIFATGYTDANGNITHFFDPENEGEVRLTVTKPDYIPHLGSFDLTGDPAVSLHDIIIIDQLDAGSEVSFVMTVKNYRDENVHGVSGTITTASPYVEIIEGTSPFGNIPPGNTAEGIDQFTILISHAAPDLIPIIFTLTLSDATGNTWDSKFLFRINGNALKPVSFGVGDGNNDYISPGQTASFRITVQNEGQQSIEEVYGNLRSKNPLLDVSDSVAYFGTIDVGESATSLLSNSFIITAFDSLMPGMTIDLEIYLYNHLGFETVESFSLLIGPISVTDPLGPCDYGYYIYGMEDTGYPFAPTYEWIEIFPALGGNGSNLGLQSDFNNSQGFTTVDLPFTFRFYGVEYDEVTISANGWISFGVTEVGSFRNFPLPGPMGPNPMVAAFWDNLSLAQGGVFTYFDPVEDIFIIQWQNARNIIGSAEVTFQIILYNEQFEPTIDDGFIKIQYRVFNNVNTSTGWPSGNWGNYCTVGIGDHTGDVGLTYTFANQYPTAAATLSHESAIMIVGPENLSEPFLIRQSVIAFDESGTGQIDAGERVRLGVYIRNIGHAPATNVSGTITTSSPYISLIEDTSPYYDIHSGTEEVNREFFEFDVSASTPNGYVADFQIVVDSADGEDSFPFHISVSRPTLQLTSYMINEIEGNGNGIIDPGETVEIILQLTNPSLSKVFNTVTNISSNSNHVSINTPVVEFGSIPQESSLQGSFTISVDENCPPGEIASLTLNIDSDNIIGFQRDLFIGIAKEDILLDFEGDDGGFISNDPDGWQWGEPSLGAYSGINAWATVLDANYADSANWTLDSPEFLITPATILSFYHNYNIEHYWDGGNVKLSMDNGANWQIIHPEEGYPVAITNSGNSGIPNQPAYSGNSNGWQEANFDLSGFFGRLVKLRWHFGSGPWVNAPGWYIDDVAISGTNPLYSAISGHVELHQSPFCPSETIIKAGSYSVKPEQNGSYMLIVPPGSYNVSAHLPYHHSDSSYQITVEELSESTDNDFTMQYFTPPHNLRYTPYEGSNLIDLSWHYDPLPPATRSGKTSRNEEDVVFVIYRQQDSGVFNPIASTEELFFTDTFPLPESVYRYYVIAEYPEGTSDKSNTISTDDPSTDQDDEIITPPKYTLRQNYPNPFNPVTNISFSLPVQEKVTLKIYNIRGELVKTLVQEVLPAGNHTVQWHGVNHRNQTVSSGIYFYDMRAGSFRETRKALLLK